jgi:hypothetical protein
MFKTPDALITGQASVEVIKSCIPAIKNPWLMPALDVDFALIAIRIATYGDSMEITTKCPSCETENEYDVNLSDWLSPNHPIKKKWNEEVFSTFRKIIKIGFYN